MEILDRLGWFLFHFYDLHILLLLLNRISHGVYVIWSPINYMSCVKQLVQNLRGIWTGWEFLFHCRAPVIFHTGCMMLIVILYRSDLVPAYVRLLRDNEAEVRIAAAGKVTKFCRILNPELAVQHILPCVKVNVKNCHWIYVKWF